VLLIDQEARETATNKTTKTRSSVVAPKINKMSQGSNAAEEETYYMDMDNLKREGQDWNDRLREDESTAEMLTSSDDSDETITMEQAFGEKKIPLSSQGMQAGTNQNGTSNIGWSFSQRIAANKRTAVRSCESGGGNKYTRVLCVRREHLLILFFICTFNLQNQAAEEEFESESDSLDSEDDIY
jgi:hypothetical protein